MSDSINPLLSLKGMVTVNLGHAGFCVQRVVEVFEVDDDERRVASLDCFEDEKIADALQVTSVHYRQRAIYVLTNGSVAFPLQDDGQLCMADEDVVATELKNEALKGMHSATRKLLLGSTE